MVLISSDSLLLITELSDSANARRRVSNLCAETHLAMVRGNVPLSLSFNHQFYTANPHKRLSRSPLGRKFAPAEQGAAIEICICDPGGECEPIIDEFLAGFRNLRRIVIGTTANTYMAHDFRGKFPDLCVCIAKYTFTGRRPFWRTIQFYGDLSQGSCLSNHWLSAMDVEISDCDSAGRGCDFEYISPTSNVTMVPNGKSPAGWSRFEPEYVEQLTIAVDFVSMFRTGQSHAANAAHRLWTFKTEGYQFPRLRKICIDLRGPMVSVLARINEMHPTTFPALDSIDIVNIPRHFMLSSPFLKHIRIRHSSHDTYISCPTCESLEVRDPTNLVFDQNTKPSLLCFHLIDHMPWSEC